VLPNQRRLTSLVLVAGLAFAGTACGDEDGPTQPGRVENQQPTPENDAGTDENPQGGSVGSDDGGADNDDTPPAGGEDLPTGGY
jgi:hypothetical protein